MVAKIACYCVKKENVTEILHGFMGWISPDEPDVYIIDFPMSKEKDFKLLRSDGTRIGEFEHTGGVGEFRMINPTTFKKCKEITVGED